MRPGPGPWISTRSTTYGVPVQLTEVTISVSGNNGVPASFTGEKTALTNEFGVATFTGLQLFSAGAYVLRWDGEGRVYAERVGR